MNKFSVSIIRDVVDYENALKRLDEIIDAEQGSPEYDELELLTILISNYEEKTFKFNEPDPIGVIEFIMEQWDLKQTDLIGILGDKTTVSKILNRKRPLTLEMVRKFSIAFKVPVDLLIKEYELA